MPTRAPYRKIPIQKTLEECRETVFSHVEAVRDEYVAKGWLPRHLNVNAGIVRGILEIFAWVLYAFYDVLIKALPKAFPLQAEKGWLDLHGEQINLERRLATKASGFVIFTRAEGVEGNIRIPSGRLVRTKPDGLGAVYRFVTLADAVLPKGEIFTRVKVEAEEYGQASNVTSGQITEIVTHIPGVAAVTNEADWLVSEGADDESDEQLQERYILAWLELAGCTSAAYKSWALSIPGVQSVKILDNHPRGEGTVGVVVRGTAGIPTDVLLNKVRAVIADKAPVNDAWAVQSPVEYPIDVTLEVEVTEGNLDSVAEQGLNAYARAGTGGPSVEYAFVAVGDGNGHPITPDSNWTALANEVWRDAPILVEVDKDNPRVVVVEMYIPHNIGGFTVREVGLFAADGKTMLAVGNYPDSYKPTVEDGAGTEMRGRFMIEHANAANTVLKIDPAIVMASREYAERVAQAKIIEHDESVNAHDRLARKSVKIIAGSGLKGGGDLSTSRTIALGDWEEKSAEDVFKVIELAGIEK